MLVGGFDGCKRCVSRVFHECFAGVSQVFCGCFVGSDQDVATSENDICLEEINQMSRHLPENFDI